MKRVLVLALFGVSIGSVGCSTTSPNTATGAGVGAALGAGTGLAIGAATHNPVAGAAVGGLLGAGVGGAVGAEADERDRARAAQVQVAQAQAQAAQAQAQAQMGITDVVEMSKNGVAPQVIINQIRTSQSRFTLTPSDVQFLTTNNVSQDVIVAMQQTQNQPAKVIYTSGGPRTVVYEDPYGPAYVAPAPVVYVRPAYGIRVLPTLVISHGTLAFVTPPSLKGVFHFTVG